MENKLFYAFMEKLLSDTKNEKLIWVKKDPFKIFDDFEINKIKKEINKLSNKKPFNILSEDMEERCDFDYFISNIEEIGEVYIGRTNYNDINFYIIEKIKKEIPIAFTISSEADEYELLSRLYNIVQDIYIKISSVSTIENKIQEYLNHVY